MNHFVFKIISTFEKTGSSKCSSKQYDIVESALAEISKAKEELSKDIELSNVYDNFNNYCDNSLINISDALGSGEFSN